MVLSDKLIEHGNGAWRIIMAVIKNIGAIKSIIFKGNLKGNGVDLPQHIKQLSSVMPIHQSAVKGLSSPSIVSFLAEQNIKELRKIRDWENIHLSLAKPFLDVNIEARAINIINENGNAVAIRVLADKNIEITGGKVPIIFKGNEFELPLKGSKGILNGIKEIIAPPMKPPAPEFEIKGRPASYFIGIGRAYVPTRPDISKFPSSDITDEMVDKEIEDAQGAFKVIADRYRNVPGNGENKQIADRIVLILEQQSKKALKLIEEKKYNFKKALEESFEPEIKAILNIKSEKFNSVGQELQMTYASLILAKHNELPDLLAGVESLSNLHNGEQVVLICEKIDFVEAASLDPNKIAGVVEVKGGIKSHTQIACKSNDIPLVIGAHDVTKKINNGDVVIVDGERGGIIVNPTRITLEKFQGLKDESVKERAFLRKKYKGERAVTKDGVEIAVMGNSKSVAESDRLSHEGVEKVALFRTEESMDVDLVSGTIVKRTREPALNEQVEFYSRVYKTLGEKEAHVVIRTMDVNGDKYITYLGEPQKDMFGQTKEGIGLCLDEKNHKPYYDLFKGQIKAILIAAKLQGAEPLIEFPMVLSVKQFKEAKKVVEKAMREMKEDKVSFESKVKYYAMVEHPNLFRATDKARIINKDKGIIESELEIDELAREADGLSLGTNDLTMKTLFEDRYSARTKFIELHPDVLFLIKKTIDAAGNAGKPLVVCGDMASDPISVPVLLGLGIRQLSVDASSPNIIKSMVCNIDIKTCEELVSEIKEIKTAEEVRKYVAEFILKRMNYGNEEHGDWKGLKELEPVLKKYIYFADGMHFNPETYKK